MLDPPTHPKPAVGEPNDATVPSRGAAGFLVGRYAPSLGMTEVRQEGLGRDDRECARWRAGTAR
jgi:hypothetical protein